MKLQGISINVVRNEYEYNKYVSNMIMKQVNLVCLGLSQILQNIMLLKIS